MCRLVSVLDKGQGQISYNNKMKGKIWYISKGPSSWVDELVG